jgi:hypothetical protein
MRNLGTTQASKSDSASWLSGMLQRKCECGQHTIAGGGCSDCASKGVLQRMTRNDQSVNEVPLIVHDVLRSPGQPLNAQTRAFMEPRFGHDFSRVRVHADSRAEESARAVNARAYTVGQQVVFGAQQYRPHDSSSRLLAHELAHVIQQRRGANSTDNLTIGSADDPLEHEADLAASRATQGSVAAVRMNTPGSLRRLQRDLATPPPAVAAPAQPNLTPDQVQEAIRFNRARYNEANTRLIQNLLGGPVTGAWTEDNIEAIANTQEEYGLPKDGKVGEATFRFLNREQRLEGMTRSNANCLVSFRLVGPDAQTFARVDPTHCIFRGRFRIEAQFSRRCNCAQFQYRQFIRGHWHRTRGGVVTDIPISLPGGVLGGAFVEDTDTTDNPPHYGHRDLVADAAPEDHYIDDAGNDDQANGCRYRSDDPVGFWVGAAFEDCQPGDRYDLLTSFRGEIQRNGAVIPGQQKFWTAINIPNWRP